MTNKHLITIVRIVASLTMLGGLLYFADLRRMVDLMTGYSPLWLILILSLIISSVWFSAWKWGVLLHAANIHLPLLRLFNMYSTGLFFNNFLPSSIGGDGVRIYLAGKAGGDTPAAASTVVIERTIATVTLAFLGLVGAVLATEPMAAAVWLLFVLLVVSIVLASIILIGWAPKFVRNGGGRWRAAWLRFAESATDIRRHRRALLECTFLSLVFQVNVTLVVMAVIAGMGLKVPGFADMLFITSASSVMAMIPIGLNGYGLREGAFVVLLSPFAFSVSEAIAVSILFALFVSFYSLWGGINWLFFKQTRQDGKVT